jgi:hypothetical protein
MEMQFTKLKAVKLAQESKSVEGSKMVAKLAVT